MTIKLTYFTLPGRAETARIMLVCSGTVFEFVQVPGPKWPELKPTTPFGYLPVFEHDGKILSESFAIDRYVAKMTGFYPDDIWSVAIADQFYALVSQGVLKLFEPTFAMKEGEERTMARKAICDGPLKVSMGNIVKAIESKTTEFISGDKPSYADIFYLSNMSSFNSGFFDGVPKNLLDDYPAAKAYRNKIANLPGVKACYEKETEGLRVAYKPDA